MRHDAEAQVAVHQATNAAASSQSTRYLKVLPSRRLHASTQREFHVPSSKPETQRAVLTGSLAPGVSEIISDLRCNETAVMRRALERLGAGFKEQARRLEVHGVALHGRALTDVPIIECDGSALVARVFMVLGSILHSPLVITGDATLRRREMHPLFQALGEKRVRHLCDPDRLPLVVYGAGMQGGAYELPGDVSSQFITALLVGAPLAEEPVTIRITGEVLSASYIRQTLAAMKVAGAVVEADADLRCIRVATGKYRPFRAEIGGDYTSASYFLALAALVPGKTTLHNLSRDSLQGERAMVAILQELGLSCEFDDSSECLTVENRRGELSGHYSFDVSDCPNILPTLAALGSFVNGVFRVTGGSVTRLHKSPRVEAMVCELRKLGVRIVPLLRNGVTDGFEIRGRQAYAGGAILSAWRDHRVFLSLLIASLAMEQPTVIDGVADAERNSPELIAQLINNGAATQLVGDTDASVTLTSP